MKTHVSPGVARRKLGEHCPSSGRQRSRGARSRHGRHRRSVRPLDTTGQAGASDPQHTPQPTENSDKPENEQADPTGNGADDESDDSSTNESEDIDPSEEPNDEPTEPSNDESDEPVEEPGDELVVEQPAFFVNVKANHADDRYNDPSNYAGAPHAAKRWVREQPIPTIGLRS